MIKYNRESNYYFTTNWSNLKQFQHNLTLTKHSSKYYSTFLVPICAIKQSEIVFFRKNLFFDQQQIFFSFCLKLFDTRWMQQMLLLWKPLIKLLFTIENLGRMRVEITLGTDCPAFLIAWKVNYDWLNFENVKFWWINVRIKIFLIDRLSWSILS